MDEELFKMDENPPLAAKVMYDISESPVGKATGQAFETTLQISAKVRAVFLGWAVVGPRRRRWL